MPLRTHRPILLLSVMALVAGGCQSGAKSQASGESASTQTSQLSKPEVRAIVTALSERIRDEVTGAATRIELATNDPEINRRTLIWKLRVARSVRRVGQYDDPRITLLSLWVLTRSQQLLLVSGTGKELFGAYQPDVVETAKKLEEIVEDAARRLLTPANFKAASKDVATYASTHPFAGTAADWSGLEFTKEMNADGMFSSVVSIPLSPFRAIGGVDRTAVAITEIADVADRFTSLVSFMPEELRWNMELILYETESSETVVQFASDLNAFANSAQSISDSVSKLVPLVEGLPATLQSEVSKTLDQIKSQQADLQKTIAEAQTLVKDINTAATSANVAEAGRTWDGAFGTFNKTLGILMPPPDPNAPAAPPPSSSDAKTAADESPPFNVNDYTAALEQLTKAAAELNTLLTGVETAAGSDTLFGRVDQSVDRTSTELGSIVNRMTWRLAAIVVFAFGLAVAYRFVAVRLIRAAA